MKGLIYHWYILAVRGGKEEKIIEEIKLELEKNKELRSYVHDLKTAKVLKGHILCYCHLTTELVNFFYRIPRIIGFLDYQKGTEELPNFVSPEVVKNFFAELAEKNELKTIVSDSNLNIGDLVKVVEGAFINYEGRITHLDKKKKKIKIIIETSGWEINGVPASSCRKVLG